MAIEIERRFLVDPGHSMWSSAGVPIVQGYIPQASGGNLRVRIAGDKACLTTKRRVAPGIRDENQLGGHRFTGSTKRSRGVCRPEVRRRTQA